MVAGADGVNVRTGPGTNYTRLGYLDPGTRAELIGRYDDWWQILYDGAPGWVFGQLVAASNAENVPQVEPPAAPTAQPPAPTTAPAEPSPTETPSNSHGLVGNSFVVSDAGKKIYAPGPFAVNQSIWCDWNIQNASSETVDYTIFGPWLEGANYHKSSWTNWHFNPSEVHAANDHLEIGTPGTYNLWLRVCFTDGECTNLMGPVAITIQ